MNKKWIILCFMILVFGSTTLHAEEKVEVIAEGVSSSVDYAMARDEAIEDALRNAVEQAVGALLDSETILQNEDLLSDRIYTHSRGYIERYSIIREGNRGGLYRVSIRALVSKGAIKDNLVAMGILNQRVNLPRVMFLIGEENLAFGTEKLRSSEQKLLETFQKRGVRVVDPNIVRRKIQRSQAIHALEGDIKAARRLGMQYGAEIVVLGKAVASESGTVLGTKLHSFHGNLALRAVRTDTGEIIATASGTANAAHIDFNTGTSIALGRAAARAGEELLARISESWSEKVNSGAVIEVNISGVETYGILSQLKNYMKSNIRGLKNVFRREYNRRTGIAILEVEIRGSALDLADRLEGVKIKGHVIEIIDATSNRIDVRLRKSE